MFILTVMLFLVTIYLTYWISQLHTTVYQLKRTIKLWETKYMVSEVQKSTLKHELEATKDFYRTKEGVSEPAQSPKPTHTPPVTRRSEDDLAIRYYIDSYSGPYANYLNNDTTSSDSGCSSDSGSSNSCD